jgi:[acyl-carrier-protein] S-malonyltransferase
MTENIKIAYIFPGQGAQKVGMGKDLYDSSEDARAVFQEADKVLGFALSTLCFEGPEEELRLTKNAQPALVTMSIAAYRAALKSVDKSKVVAPAYVAGHSLGEYTALVLAGVLDFASAVYLARERGRLMFEAGQKTPGSMAAILGLDEAMVKAVCQETGTWLANINCPGQLVISGAKENIDKAVELSRAKGAARAVPLQVSGAFHSPLMQPAVEGLAAAMDKLNFKEPTIPVIANTSAMPLTTTQAIQDELLQQLCNSVQWQRSVENMLKNGTTVFMEIGAGNVLTGLVKRIDKNVRTINIGTLAELGNILVK